MRYLPAKTLLAAAGTLLAAACAIAQTPAATKPATQDPQEQPFAQDGPSYSITAKSTLVLVPALVKTKSGQLVYTLKADDFILTDDGVTLPLHLEEDNGGQPLALVICVEVGGAGRNHLHDYDGLGAMLDNMLGAIPHKVAIVAFDSTPTLVHRYSSHLDSISQTLASQESGDSGSAVLDAVNFSVDQLRPVPTTYRRAILLLSETKDNGSHTTLAQALRAISDTNTAIYSVAFSSNRAEQAGEASKLEGTEPGPEHGCFSHDPKTDKVVKDDGSVGPAEESKGTQYYDCAAQLFPPLVLARMAEIAARNMLRKNISESVAKLTGGESFTFKNVKTLDRDLFTIANHIPNRYVLSFHPQRPHPGLHAVSLKLKNYPNLVVEARSSYWVDDDAAVAPAK
jgi:VWFA-related protein